MPSVVDESFSTYFDSSDEDQEYLFPGLSVSPLPPSEDLGQISSHVSEADYPDNDDSEVTPNPSTIPKVRISTLWGRLLISFDFPGHRSGFWSRGSINFVSHLILYIVYWIFWTYSVYWLTEFLLFQTSFYTS